MGASGSIVLQGAEVIRRDGTVEGPCDIVINSGVIQEVAGSADRTYPQPTAATAAGTKKPTDCGVVDCTGLFVSPGLMNLHTHSQ